MILFSKRFLRAFAIRIGRCCPKKRRSFDVMMGRVTRDPLLLKKLAVTAVLQVSDANGTVKYSLKGKHRETPIEIKLKCFDISFFEAVLNGENPDKLRLWAEEKIVMIGDLATCMIVTDAFFRYAELIGRFNLPWSIYRLFGRNLILEGSCIPTPL